MIFYLVDCPHAMMLLLLDMGFFKIALTILWIQIPLIIYSTKFRMVDRTILSQSVTSLVAITGLKHQQGSPVWFI